MLLQAGRPLHWLSSGWLNNFVTTKAKPLPDAGGVAERSEPGTRENPKLQKSDKKNRFKL